jgi:hypothetical protein
LLEAFERAVAVGDADTFGEREASALQLATALTRACLERDLLRRRPRSRSRRRRASPRCRCGTSSSTCGRRTREPRSRSTVERLARRLGDAVLKALPVVEREVRAEEGLPAEARSSSVGLDRTTAPMAEDRDGDRVRGGSRRASGWDRPIGRGPSYRGITPCTCR